MRGYDWATRIKDKLTDPAIKNVAVIGAGYMGWKPLKLFKKQGKK